MSKQRIENYNSVSSVGFTVLAYLLFFILGLLAIGLIRGCAPEKINPRVEQRLEQREELSVVEEALLGKIGIEGESSRRSLVEGISSLEKRAARKTSILDPSSPTALNPPVKEGASASGGLTGQDETAQTAQSGGSLDVVEISEDDGDVSNDQVLQHEVEARDADAEGSALETIIEATKTIITAPAEALKSPDVIEAH